MISHMVFTFFICHYRPSSSGIIDLLYLIYPLLCFTEKSNVRITLAEKQSFTHRHTELMQLRKWLWQLFLLIMLFMCCYIQVCFLTFSIMDPTEIAFAHSHQYFFPMLFILYWTILTFFGSNLPFSVCLTVKFRRNDTLFRVSVKFRFCVQ